MSIPFRYRFEDGLRALWSSCTDRVPEIFSSAHRKGPLEIGARSNPLFALVPEDPSAPAYEARLVTAHRPSKDNNAYLEISRLWPGKGGNHVISAHYFDVNKKDASGGYASVVRWNENLDFSQRICLENICLALHRPSGRRLCISQ